MYGVNDVAANDTVIAIARAGTAAPSDKASATRVKKA